MWQLEKAAIGGKSSEAAPGLVSSQLTAIGVVDEVQHCCFSLIMQAPLCTTFIRGMRNHLSLIATHLDIAATPPRLLSFALYARCTSSSSSKF
eukprot:COSAG02_NODE_35599_length_466_cov_0.732970_1_plen_92_part_01